MRAPDLLRYSLLLATAATAHANRRHYRMPTTWLPHLTINAAALLMPDVVRLIGARAQRPDGEGRPGLLQLARETLTQVAAENPGYVLHIAPFTAGYLTSHPQFDIYKGPMGELRLAGFGLDALPHGATALALTLLAGDALRAAAQSCDRGSRLGRAIGWCAARRALATGGMLALLTLVWESGEWLALRYELRQRGDPAQINMQWSIPDTLRDCAANAAGWALACLVRREWM